jgi:IS30 family transposase
LVLDYPDDLEMRVSHETIYQSLFVQGRGALRQESRGACGRGARSVVHSDTPLALASCNTGC